MFDHVNKRNQTLENASEKQRIKYLKFAPSIEKLIKFKWLAQFVGDVKLYGDMESCWHDFTQDSRRKTPIWGAIAKIDDTLEPLHELSRTFILTFRFVRYSTFCSIILCVLDFFKPHAMLHTSPTKMDHLFENGAWVDRGPRPAIYLPAPPRPHLSSAIDYNSDDDMIGAMNNIAMGRVTSSPSKNASANPAAADDKKPNVPINSGVFLVPCSNPELMWFRCQQTQIVYKDFGLSPCNDVLSVNFMASTCVAPPVDLV